MASAGTAGANSSRASRPSTSAPATAPSRTGTNEHSAPSASRRATVPGSSRKLPSGARTSSVIPTWNGIRGNATGSGDDAAEGRTLAGLRGRAIEGAGSAEVDADLQRHRVDEALLGDRVGLRALALLPGDEQ